MEDEDKIARLEELYLQFKNKERLQVLDDGTEPYKMVNNDCKQSQALWAKDLYDRYVTTTGETKIHPRGLHYFIVMLDEEIRRVICRKTKPTIDKETGELKPMWEVYTNTSECYTHLTECIKYARYLNLIPYECILDEKNSVETIINCRGHETEFSEYVSLAKPSIIEELEPRLPTVLTYYKTFDEYLDGVSNQYARELVKGDIFDLEGLQFDENLVKPFTIEVWSENALPRYIMALFANKVDTVVIGKGNLSLTVAYDYVQRLNERNQNGIVLYMSDFDVAGTSMAADMAHKIHFLKDIGVLKQKAYVHSLLLTPEQMLREEFSWIKEKMYPKFEKKDKKKSYETRISKWREKYGKGFVELQALEVRPDFYKRIIEEELNKWITEYTEISEVIEAHNESLMIELIFIVREELNKHLDELKEYYDNYTKLAADIKAKLPDSDAIKKQYQEARDLKELKFDIIHSDILRRIREEIVLPEVIPPKMDKEAPHECMFDTERDGLKQDKILRNIKMKE